MIKLSACIEMLFTEVPFAERISAAKEAGFDAVEFWDWSENDLSALADLAAAQEMPMAVCCVGTRDAARKAQYAQGALLRPENAGVYQEMVQESLEAVAPLGIRTLIATVGQTLPGIPRQAQRDSIITCLQSAAPVLEARGATLVVEPLNTLVDHKGYYLERSQEAFAILDAVHSPSVKLLYDVYHQQITEGNIIATLTTHASQIGHIHIADVPGRCQPGTGELNYSRIFQAIAGTGYRQYVGCEYRPSAGVASREAARAAIERARAY